MHKVCGKIEQKLRLQPGKVWVSSSTVELTQTLFRLTERVKALFLHEIFPMLSLYISPPKNSFLPPFEHYFYPVSTAPTINNIKEK